MPTLLRQARILAFALLLGLITLGGTEAIALASPSPTVDQMKAAASAAQHREGVAALSCPGAQHARSAGRHYFNLAEAQQCAPGATVVTESHMLVTGPETLIVKVAGDQYVLVRVAPVDLSAVNNNRTVSAAFCPDTRNWSTNTWYADAYLGNTTSWSIYFSWCGGGARAHANWVSPSCIGYWPWVCNGSTINIFNQDTQLAFTSVTNAYGSFCCSAVRSAWQEMDWSQSQTSWLFYYWFNF